MSHDEERVELDPYQCVVKKNQKFVNDCTEVFLAKNGATHLSSNFRHFQNLEVIWMNSNRLSRIEHLENNFRLREVFVQDNRLVSLTGLSPKKQPFLKVLLASNNQLRSLEKQLGHLSSFSFMTKLDLFGNPCAEESDYRLKTVYQLPHIDTLDRHTVTQVDRAKAEEVVPNLDKVAGPKPEKPKKKGMNLSIVEKDCLTMARTIKARREGFVDSSLDMNLTQAVSADTKAPTTRLFQTNRDLWLQPKRRLQEEHARPNPWEKGDMAKQIQKAAGKDAVTQAELESLVQRLASEGLRECGRRLATANVLAALPRRTEPSMTSRPQTSATQATAAAAATNAKSKAASKPAPAAGAPLQQQGDPLEAIANDPAATCPIGVVADWLLTFEWPRPEDTSLDRDIKHLYEQTQRAQLIGKQEDIWSGLHTALRLEGVKTLARESSSGPPTQTLGKTRPRMDFFRQNMLVANKEVDESTGRLALKVTQRKQSTPMCSLAFAAAS